MKIQVRDKLYLICFLVFIGSFGYAQNDTLQLLKGEWYSFDSTQPDVNDSFRLRREKTYSSYVKWEFRENGSFYKQDVPEMQEPVDSLNSVMILNEIESSTWVFNKEKQTVELRDLSRLYKITGINKNFLELVRLK